MKINNSAILLLCLLIFGCFTKDNSVDPEKIENKYDKVGFRLLEINSEEKIEEHNYLKCLKHHTFDSSQVLLVSKFRKSENSIRLLIDTSKVSEVFPDSLRGIVKVEAEEEVKLLSLPFVKDEKWPVVKSCINYQTFRFNTIDVEATFLGEETLTLAEFNALILAEKIQDKLDVNLSDINNPFIS